MSSTALHDKLFTRFDFSHLKAGQKIEPCFFFYHKNPFFKLFFSKIKTSLTP